MTTVEERKARILREIWHDPEDGFGSRKDTYKQAVKRDPSISLADVKQFFEKQESLYRKRGKELNSYVADYPCQQIQVDIADFAAEVAKDFSGMQRYAELLISKLRELGGSMDAGKAGTFLRAQGGFSDALQSSKATKLREFLEAFEGWTIEGGRAGGKTTLKLIRKRTREKSGQIKSVDKGGAKYRYALFTQGHLL